MNPTAKKLLAVGILIVSILVLSILLGSLGYSAFIAEEPSADLFSLVFVSGLLLFPISYGIRLWKEGGMKVKHDSISVDPATRIQVQVQIMPEDYRKLIFLLTYRHSDTSPEFNEPFTCPLNEKIVESLIDPITRTVKYNSGRL